MAKEYSNTEWIEQYLRGELHGNDLTHFEERLIDEPILKEEFDLHFILAKAIQEAKKNELKSYLKENTKSKKRSLFEYNWVFSAAAAVILLVASVSVYFIIKKPVSNLAQKNTSNNSNSKSNNEPQFSSADKDVNYIDKGKNEFSVKTDTTKAIASNETIDNEMDGTMDMAVKDSDEESIGNLPAGKNANINDAQMVLTALIAVEQENTLNTNDETKISTTAVVRSTNKNEVLKKKNKAVVANDAEKLKSAGSATFMLDTVSLNKKPSDVLIYSLQVTYYETQRGNQKYSQNAKELKLYNLPYNNPRIYYKNGFLLLENGGKVYDINAKGIELDLNEIVP